MRCPSVPLPRSSAKHFCYLGHEVNSSAWVYALWLESHPRALRRSHWWELVPKTSEKLVSAIEHKPTFIPFSVGTMLAERRNSRFMAPFRHNETSVEQRTMC